MSLLDLTEEQAQATQNMTPSVPSAPSVPSVPSVPDASPEARVAAAPAAVATSSAMANSAAPSPTEILKKRHAMIEKLLLQSLDEPDPLDANLGAASSDLFEFALYVKESISATMAQAPNALEAVPNLLPSMQLYMSLARQSERIAKIPKKRIEPNG